MSETEMLAKAYKSMTKKELFEIAFSYAQRLSEEKTEVAIKEMKSELRILGKNNIL